MAKSIFITGAASGIGKATAISFAKKGWNVGLFDINQEGLKDVAEIIGHNKCMYQKLDVTNIRDWIEAERSFSQYTGGKCDIFFIHYPSSYCPINTAINKRRRIYFIISHNKNIRICYFRNFTFNS